MTMCLWLAQGNAALGRRVSLSIRPMPWTLPSIHEYGAVAGPRNRRSWESGQFVDSPIALDAAIRL